MIELKCPFCGKKLQLALNVDGREFYWCGNYDCDGVNYGVGNKELWQELIRTRKALDKGMEHITGLNNMIESWLNLINSDLDQETKLHILKSAISAYVENKGGNNEK